MTGPATSRRGGRSFHARVARLRRAGYLVRRAGWMLVTVNGFRLTHHGLRGVEGPLMGAAANLSYDRRRIRHLRFATALTAGDEVTIGDENVTLRHDVRPGAEVTAA